jgi:hypothetical protein
MIKHDIGNRPILRTGPWILAGVVAAALAGPAVVRVASSENWSAPAAAGSGVSCRTSRVYGGDATRLDHVDGSARRRILAMR